MTEAAVTPHNKIGPLPVQDVTRKQGNSSKEWIYLISNLMNGKRI